MFFQLGIDHILDINGYDHMLFIIVLSAGYYVEEVKKILLLLTAFTVGHSITLALSTMDLVAVNTDYIEMLIKVTIAITALTNIVLMLVKPLSEKQNKKVFTLILAYFIVFFFGLIHGLGFASYLKTLLFDYDSIFMPLLQFNLGVEVGQIIIFGVYFIITSLVFRFISKLKNYWSNIISIIVFFIAMYLIFS